MTPNPILSDALVEKAAKGIRDVQTRSEGYVDIVDVARAALEAVLSDLVEACAKVVETENAEACVTGEVWILNRAANRIRSLLPPSSTEVK